MPPRPQVSRERDHIVGRSTDHRREPSYGVGASLSDRRCHDWAWCGTKTARVQGRVVVLDIAFAATVGSSVSFALFIEGLGDRLAAWIDHHELDFAGDPRFVLRTKGSTGHAPPAVVTARRMPWDLRAEAGTSVGETAIDPSVTLASLAFLAPWRFSATRLVSDRREEQVSMKRTMWRVVKPLRDSVRAGHPWIYDRALAPPKNIAVGDVVTLVDEKGPLATALADPSSPLRARVLDLSPEASCDGAWARGRVEAAAKRRVRDPLLVGCTGRRIVHGEGDACPGLVIDVYGDTAVIVFDGPAASVFWRARLNDVIAGMEHGGIEIKHAWVKGERRDRSAGEAVRGDPPALIVMSEDEAKFGVDVRSGQKTGFFLDQRDNRRTVRKHAAGATVLNLFSYTGGFSLHAALGGATKVTSVDIAPPAIAAIEANLKLSGLSAESHERVAADAFEFLGRSKAQRRRWDLVIVDPPSFAPSERAKGAALKAYEKLAVAGLEVVEAGGRFAFASCSSHVTESDLLDVISWASIKVAGPILRLRHSAGAASDHPVLPAFDEGRYLKFLFFDVG